MAETPNLGCKIPPEGWYCSRKPGHEGPCAARPFANPVSGLSDLLDQYDDGRETRAAVERWVSERIEEARYRPLGQEWVSRVTGPEATND